MGLEQEATDIQPRLSDSGEFLSALDWRTMGETSGTENWGLVA